MVGARRSALPGASSNGAAYVFERTNAGWSDGVQLTAGGGDERACFGELVSIAGNHIAVSTPCSASRIATTVYLFGYDGATWDKMARLDNPDLGANGFAHALSLGLRYVAVGAPSDNLMGAAYVFRAEAGSFGDADLDGDLDLHDFGALQACFTGSDAPLEDCCNVFDFDSDGDVDLNDFDRFQTSPKQAAPYPKRR